MGVAILGRQKIVLQRAAWKKGWPSFITQGIRAARDLFWSKRQVIHKLSVPTAFRALENQRYKNIRYRVRRSEFDFSREERDYLLAHQKELGWGTFDWFDLGWTIWSLEIEGKLAAFMWWRTSEQARDFLDIPDGAILNWQITVLPEYRGARLMETLVNNYVKYHVDHGVLEIYGSCRDWHSTSLGLFKRNGWKPLGYFETYKASNAKLWRPAGAPGWLERQGRLIRSAWSGAGKLSITAH